MVQVRARALCPRCLESFVRESGAGPLCPSCLEHETERARHVTMLAPTPPETATGAPGPSPAAPERVDAPVPLPRRIREFLPEQARQAREWCDGRMPWFRMLLWIYLAYTFGRHFGSSEPYRSLFDGINLGIHELGHQVFRPLGMTLMAAGGTIAQLAAPIASLFIFRWQRDFFGVAVGLCWLATNFWGISVYIGDARAQKLPLIAPGMGLMPGGDTSGMGGIIHDWNFLLGPPGLLRYDTLFSGMFATAAVVTMLAGLAFGAWLIVRMLLSKEGQRIDWSEFR